METVTAQRKWREIASFRSGHRWCGRIRSGERDPQKFQAESNDAHVAMVTVATRVPNPVADFTEITVSFLQEWGTEARHR